jgi:hypothetical protein
MGNFGLSSGKADEVDSPGSQDVLKVRPGKADVARAPQAKGSCADVEIVPQFLPVDHSVTSTPEWSETLGYAAAFRDLLAGVGSDAEEPLQLLYIGSELNRADSLSEKI